MKGILILDSNSACVIKKQPDWKLTSGLLSKTLTAGIGSFSRGCCKLPLLKAIFYF